MAIKLTYKQKGETVDYVNSGSSKIEAGTIVSLTTRIGIAAGDIAAGATGALLVTGVFEGAKDENAITLGAVVYYDAESDALTATASGNVPAGWAVKAAGASDTAVQILVAGIDASCPAAATVTAVSAANGVAAAGEAPTKAEFDAVVTLANAEKTAVNAVIAALKAAGLMSNA